MSYFLELLIVCIALKVVLGDITCSEEYCCEHDNLEDEEVWCIGYNSCLNSTIESDVTFCSGNYGCAYSDIETEKLFCSGNEGCNSGTIVNTGTSDDTFSVCTGFYSCQSAEITATDTVTVFASAWAGNEATVTGQDVYSISSTGFTYGSATVSGELWCDGVYSCAASDISFESDCDDELIVQVLGAYALHSSTISSGENNEISWYFYGLWSLVYATISCESGSTCNFYCVGGGCLNYETASYTCNGECNIYCVYTFDDACPSTGTSDDINVYVLQGDELAAKYLEIQSIISERADKIKGNYLSIHPKK